MKLLRFGKKGAEKPGVEIKGKRLDCSQHFEDWNHDFFQNAGLEKLKTLVQSEGDKLPAIGENVRIGSPVARPGMIMCVGLNYSDHAKESGMDIPEEPIIFMKATHTLTGPYDAVTIPKNSTKTDWEVELGMVIGKEASYLADEAAAADCIAGYCVVNDVSERAFQLERGGQWVKGKSCLDFSPVGPYLVLKEDVADVSNLKMKLSVNGETRQDGNTKFMIFNPTYIVWYLSQFTKLEAGDLIFTGTPPGVGLGMTPPVYLQDGDEVTLNIEGLGSQTQKFIAYQA